MAVLKNLVFHAGWKRPLQTDRPNWVPVPQQRAGRLPTGETRLIPVLRSIRQRPMSVSLWIANRFLHRHWQLTAESYHCRRCANITRILEIMLRTPIRNMSECCHHLVYSAVWSLCSHLLQASFLFDWFSTWRWYVLPKRRFTYRLHSAISQTMAKFITTAVRTSNPGFPFTFHFQIAWTAFCF
jgi:hypothetical protein